MDKRQDLYRQSFGEAIEPSLEVAYQLKELNENIKLFLIIALNDSNYIKKNKKDIDLNVKAIHKVINQMKELIK
tara:strand:+ start:294 stop:515 length:222 start_codon:yes stop_codon:yes gene_type:complete